MRAGLFWLNDKQRAWIAPHLPTNMTGSERDDDRRIISGVIHMLHRSTPSTGNILSPPVSIGAVASLWRPCGND
jgi:hypothetical protein